MFVLFCFFFLPVCVFALNRWHPHMLKKWVVAAVCEQRGASVRKIKGTAIEEVG